jgi:hypothetical protein
MHDFGRFTQRLASSNDSYKTIRRKVGEQIMGYVEITRPDGTKTLLGEVPVLICQMCNEMPHFDETVRIVSIAPIQWQCEKCHAVNG